MGFLVDIQQQWKLQFWKQCLYRRLFYARQFFHVVYRCRWSVRIVDLFDTRLIFADFL
jgi:hypothetical protein